MVTARGRPKGVGAYYPGCLRSAQTGKTGDEPQAPPGTDRWHLLRAALSSQVHGGPTLNDKNQRMDSGFQAG